MPVNPKGTALRNEGLDRYEKRSTTVPGRRPATSQRLAAPPAGPDRRRRRGRSGPTGVLVEVVDGLLSLAAGGDECSGIGSQDRQPVAEVGGVILVGGLLESELCAPERSAQLGNEFFGSVCIALRWSMTSIGKLTNSRLAGRSSWLRESSQLRAMTAAPWMSLRSAPV